MLQSLENMIFSPGIPINKVIRVSKRYKIPGSQFYIFLRSIRPGIHGPPGPGTYRSESVRDFQNFVGPGPVPGFEIFLGSGPSWSGISKIASVMVRAGPGFLKFSRSWSGPVLGPGQNRSVRDQPVRGSLH